MKILLALSTILAANTTVAAAASFTGNWPLTVTNSQHMNGVYCLTLTDDGGFGWQHSGLAVLVGQPVGTLPYGTFQDIDHTIMVTMQEQGGNGQDAGLVFVAHAPGDRIGGGVAEQVYGGEEFDSGVVVFGARGGC